MKRLILICAVCLLQVAQGNAQYNVPEIISPQEGDTIQQELRVRLTSAGSTGIKAIVEYWPKGETWNKKFVESNEWAIELPELKLGEDYVLRARYLGPQGITKWSKEVGIVIGDGVRHYSSREFDFNTKLDLISIGSLWSYAKRFEVEVDTVASFNSSFLRGDTFSYGSKYAVQGDFFAKTVYYRIRGFNSHGKGPWSYGLEDVFQAPVIQRVRPSVGYRRCSFREFSIQEHPEASIEFQLSTDLEFKELVVDTNISGPDIAINSLHFKKQYFSRARWVRAGKESSWSRVGTSWHEGPYVSHYNVETMRSRSANLNADYSWSKGEVLEVQLDTTDDFSSPVVLLNGSPKSFQIGNHWKNRTQYLRVRAKHKTDTSDWDMTQFNLYPTEHEVYVNNIPEGRWNGFREEVYAGGILNFSNEPDGFAGVEVVLYPSNDTANKVNLKSTSKIVALPDLYFDTQYNFKYRVSTKSDFTEDWSHRVLQFHTLLTPDRPVFEQSENWAGRTISLNDAGFDLDAIRIQVLREPWLPETVVLDTTVENEVYHLFSFGDRYFARGQLVNTVDTSGWSTNTLFRVVDAPVVVSFNGQNVRSDLFDLIWEYDPTVTKYELQVSWDRKDLEKAERVTLETGNYEFKGELGKRYLWRVRALSSVDTSAWSYIHSFSMGSVSIDDQGIGAKLEFYPNPATDHVFIDEARGTKLTVYTTEGKAVLSYAVNSDHELIDMSLLESGIYLFEVVGQSETQRGLVEKR